MLGCYELGEIGNNVMVSYRIFRLVYVMKKELYKSRREFICLRDQFSKVCEFRNKKAMLPLPAPYMNSSNL